MPTDIIKKSTGTIGPIRGRGKDILAGYRVLGSGTALPNPTLGQTGWGPVINAKFVDHDTRIATNENTLATHASTLATLTSNLAAVVEPDIGLRPNEQGDTIAVGLSDFTNPFRFKDNTNIVGILLDAPNAPGLVVRLKNAVTNGVYGVLTGAASNASNPGTQYLDLTGAPKSLPAFTELAIEYLTVPTGIDGPVTIWIYLNANVTGTTPVVQPPDTATSVHGAVGNGSITVSWNLPTTGTTANHQKVALVPTAGGLILSADIADGTTTSHTFTVTNGVSYIPEVELSADGGSTYGSLSLGTAVAAVASTILGTTSLSTASPDTNPGAGFVFGSLWVAPASGHLQKAWIYILPGSVTTNKLALCLYNVSSVGTAWNTTTITTLIQQSPTITPTGSIGWFSVVIPSGAAVVANTTYQVAILTSLNNAHVGGQNFELYPNNALTGQVFSFQGVGTGATDMVAPADWRTNGSGGGSNAGGGSAYAAYFEVA